MITRPNCKINLGLHVTGKRPDGYHNIETVFLPVHTLCDELEITPSDSFSFVQQGIPVDCPPEQNICVKAYNLLLENFPHKVQPVAMRLVKNVPFGAGLGGGSADAAFVLKMLNSMMNLNLSTADLRHYASRIGADCPFFIQNTPAYATGIGDQLQPVDVNLDGYHIVIEKPDDSVSTREAYAGLLLQNKQRPDLRQVMQMPVEQWRQILVNDFEQSIFPSHPAIAALKQNMYQRGAVYASMTGSGAAVFGIFEN